jgi:hypothetical protein
LGLYLSFSFSHTSSAALHYIPRLVTTLDTRGPYSPRHPVDRGQYRTSGGEALYNDPSIGFCAWITLHFARTTGVTTGNHVQLQ